ncbi:MAG: hypothetical protein HUJ97_00245 [Bacteroidales bacterium]|nr:hypothetical protein [Bacteroidales bacterium]
MNNLTFDQKWDLFKLMVAESLYNIGFKFDAKEFAECLDMSFEEDYLHTDMKIWPEMMLNEALDLRKEAPELFAEIH